MKYLLIAILLTVGGCSQTIYDRETITIDPNGVTTIERVHVGATSVATDKTIESLVIRTARGIMSLNGASADNDSIKATTPYGTLETKGLKDGKEKD